MCGDIDCWICQKVEKIFNDRIHMLPKRWEKVRVLVDVEINLSK